MSSENLTLPISIEAENMTGAQIAAIIDVASLIEGWLKAVKAEGKSREAKKPGSVPGYGIRPGNRSRAWKSNADALKGMSAIGINDPYVEPTLKTVAAVEKDLSEEKIEKLKAYWDWHPGTPALKKLGSDDATNPSTVFTDQAQVMDGNAKPDW